jgi:hypothetical protein
MASDLLLPRCGSDFLTTLGLTNPPAHHPPPMSPVGTHLTTCCGFGPSATSKRPSWGTLTTHLPPAAVPGPAPLAAPCCTPLQPAVVLGPATLGPYGHFRGGCGVPPKLRPDTEGCGFGQGDHVFTRVLMNALMPSLLTHTLHPGPFSGSQHLRGSFCCPLPPALSPLLFIADTFPHLPPFLLYRGHYNIFGGHAYYGILWEVAHISLTLLLLYVSITGAVPGL